MDEIRTVPTFIWWEEQNYLAGKEIEGGLWICLASMITTTRLMICTPAPDGGLHEFWCYPRMADAFAAYEVFDGRGDPLDGWVKHYPSERRRFRAGVRCFAPWCGADLSHQPVRTGSRLVGPGSSSGPACEKHATDA